MAAEQVLFVGGTYVKPKPGELPHWNDFHKTFYVYGFRWIKTKRKWSGVCILHSFRAFEWCEDPAL